jgi:transposase-like protein
VLALPEKYRRRLKSTNMQERRNEEIRRRKKMIRIFPNDQAAIRMVGALLAKRTTTGKNARISIWTSTTSGNLRRLSSHRPRRRPGMPRGDLRIELQQNWNLTSQIDTG